MTIIYSLHYKQNTRDIKKQFTAIERTARTVSIQAPLLWRMDFPVLHCNASQKQSTVLAFTKGLTASSLCKVLTASELFQLALYGLSTSQTITVLHFNHGFLLPVPQHTHRLLLRRCHFVSPSYVCSRAQLYCAGLPAGWSGVRVPAGDLFTTTPIPALGPTQPPIQWVPVAFSLEGKATGSWS